MKKASLYLVVCISIVLCFLMITPDSRATGYGFFLNYGYGELDLEDTTDEAIHNSFGAGVLFDTNISRKKIFNYRITVSAVYNIIDHYRYDYYWYGYYDYYHDIKRPEEVFYHDEGWGLGMSHSFLFGIMRKPRYRLSVGPSVKLGYNQFFGLEGRSWIYRTVGAGPELTFNYHLNEKTSLSVILNYYSESSINSEIDSYKEDFFCLKLSYVFRSASERVTLAAEPAPPALETGSDSKTASPGTVEPDSVIGHSEDANTTGFLIFRCHPQQCQVTINRRVFQKESPLLIVSGVPPGKHKLSITWGDRSVEGEITITGGSSQSIMVNRDAVNIDIQQTECLRYLDNGDGTVTDVFSLLQWSTAPIHEVYNWQNAKQQVQALSIAGYNNWRLPTILELEDLLDSPYGQCSPKQEQTLSLPPVFNLSGVACWSSTEGEYSVMRNSSSIWIMNFRNGKREWSDPIRRRQVLPVRWTDDCSIVWEDLSSQALQKLRTQTSRDILGENIPLLNTDDFREKVFNSNRPSAVLFIKELNENIDGICQVFSYLEKTFKRSVNFYCHIIGPQGSSLFSTILNAETPATIALYSGNEGRISLGDTYSGLIDRPELFKQKYYQLGLWIFDKLISQQQGFFHQGQYLHLNFSGGNEPRTETIPGQQPDDYKLLKW